MTTTTDTDPGAEQAWWVDFYDEWLELMLLDEAGGARLERTLDFLWEALELEPGARVFDQCCGNGRVALPLAAREITVHGVDQAASYIERATACAVAEGLDDRATFVAGDAFEYVARPTCDAAINWWTSFGYAPTDEGNRAMLERARDSLVAGGRLALDFLNLPGVLRHFAPHVIDRREAPDGSGEVVLTRESRVDVAAGVLRKRWTYFLPGGERVEHDSAVRLLMPHRIGQMMADVGLEVVAMYGGTDASPLTMDSPRCVIVARRL